jgi:hypothetical protein
LSISYVIYGLRVISNQPIPGLADLGMAGPIPLRIWLKEPARFASKFSMPLRDVFYVSPNVNQAGESNLHAGMLCDGAYYGFFYSDGPKFVIDRQGGEIWGDWPDGYSLEDACTYLIGQVINFALLLRGATSLHASSIAIGDRAIAILGAPGAGKSTTAAAFARLGYAILSDDVAVLDDRGSTFLVQTGYPRVNLWPDSERALFGYREELPHITPTWGKKYLPLDRGGYSFQSHPLLLGALYRLDVLGDTLEVSAPEELKPPEAFVTLVANTYLNHLLDADMRSREFEVLGRVARSVPMRRACPALDPSKVYEFCEAIAADARRLRAGNPANAVSGSL